MSAQTKIREPFLEAIELGRYGVLPPVYVRSFIRTYAKALRLPSTEIDSLVNRVLATDDDDRSFVPQSLRNPSKVVQPHESRSEPKVPLKQQLSEAFHSIPKPTIALPSFLQGRRGLLALAILIVVAGTLFLFLRNAAKNEGEGTSDDPSSTIGVGANENPLDSMILTALAADTSWLTITMDSMRTQQLVMLPGQEQRWSAMKEFKVALGNAGALTFSRNGISLPPFGKKGEAVRSVTITRNDVVSSASASRQTLVPRPTATAATPQPKPVVQQRVVAKPKQIQRVPAPARKRYAPQQRAPQPSRKRWQQPQRRKPAPPVRRAAVNAPRRPTITPAPVIPR